MPGLYVDTVRPQKVWITALDENGQEYEYAEGGNGSFIALHEMDHFEGKCTLFNAYDEAEKHFLEMQKNNKTQE